MESIHSPFSSLSVPTFLTKLKIQQKTTHIPFITKQIHRLPPHSLLKTQALNNTFAIAANTSGSIGGDISVLLPISGLLLFMYWVANFVVPEIVVKELERQAPERKEKPEQQISTFERSEEDIESAEYRQPKKKMKKADLKKMINSKRF